MSHNQRRAYSNQGPRGSGGLLMSGAGGKGGQQKQTKLPRLLSGGESMQNSLDYYGLDIGVNSQQGRRPYQEDEFSIRPSLKVKANTNSSGEVSETHFFGLFDGHAGGRCSKFVSTSFADALLEDPAYGHNLPQAVKRTFFSTNEAFLQIAERMKLHDGSTGITSIVRDGKVLVSNVGDCRCIILSNGKPIQMSVDQKPTTAEEQRRIAALGGTVVFCMGTARVNGVLAVSRAFGNRTLRAVIRPDPELSMRELTKDDDYLVMASDGLWDVLRNIDVCHIAYNCANSNGAGHAHGHHGHGHGHGGGGGGGAVCQAIAEELVHAALSRGSLDNVTCICVKISGTGGLYTQHQQNLQNQQNQQQEQQQHNGNGNGASAAAAYRNAFNSNTNGNSPSRNGSSNAPSPAPGASGGVSGGGSTVVDMLSAIMSSTSGGNRSGKGTPSGAGANDGGGGGVGGADQGVSRGNKKLHANMAQHQNRPHSTSNGMDADQSSGYVAGGGGGPRSKLTKSQSMKRFGSSDQMVGAGGAGAGGGGGGAGAYSGLMTSGLGAMSIVDDSDNITVSSSALALNSATENANNNSNNNNNINGGGAGATGGGSLSRFLTSGAKLRSGGAAGGESTRGGGGQGFGSYMTTGGGGGSAYGLGNSGHVPAPNAANLSASPIIMHSQVKRPVSQGGAQLQQQQQMRGGGAGAANGMPMIYHQGQSGVSTGGYAQARNAAGMPPSQSNLFSLNNGGAAGQGHGHYNMSATM